MVAVCSGYTLDFFGLAKSWICRPGYADLLYMLLQKVGIFASWVEVPRHSWDAPVWRQIQRVTVAIPGSHRIVVGDRPQNDDTIPLNLHLLAQDDHFSLQFASFLLDFAEFVHDQLDLC